MKTELKNRILWFDGTNEVKYESDIINLIVNNIPISKIVSNCAEAIEFNNLSDEKILSNKDSNFLESKKWNVPQSYLDFNLLDHVRMIVREKYNTKEYINRLEIEIKEIEKRNLLTSFKCIYYIIDTFNKNNIVYGVGRGSSCASLFLFLLKFHLVDPVLYNINYNEFFHD